jgi:hypothetical protein
MDDVRSSESDVGEERPVVEDIVPAKKPMSERKKLAMDNMRKAAVAKRLENARVSALARTTAALEKKAAELHAKTELETANVLAAEVLRKEKKDWKGIQKAQRLHQQKPDEESSSSSDDQEPPRRRKKRGNGYDALEAKVTELSTQLLKMRLKLKYQQPVAAAPPAEQQQAEELSKAAAAKIRSNYIGFSMPRLME